MASSSQMRYLGLTKFTKRGIKALDIKLGEGFFGFTEKFVLEGRRQVLGKTYKKFSLYLAGASIDTVMQRFQYECELLAQIHHPNIVEFIGIAFFQEYAPTLITELLPSNLENFINKPEEIHNNVKLHILSQIARGLVYLHGHTPPLVHLDLTSHNVLLSEDSSVVRLSDIRNIAIVDAEKVREFMHTNSVARAYMPPEIITAVSPLLCEKPVAVDIFSFGHLALYTMIRKFPGNLPPKIYKETSYSELERRMEYFRILCKVLDNQSPVIPIIKRCLEDLPQMRPEACEVLDHINSQLTADTTEYYANQSYDGVNNLLKGEPDSLEMYTSSQWLRRGSWKNYSFHLSQSSLICVKQSKKEIIHQIPFTNISKAENEDSSHHTDKSKCYFRISFHGKLSPWLLRAPTKQKCFDWICAINQSSQKPCAPISETYSSQDDTPVIYEQSSTRVMKRESCLFEKRSPKSASFKRMSTPVFNTVISTDEKITEINPSYDRLGLVTRPSMRRPCDALPSLPSTDDDTLYDQVHEGTSPPHGDTHLSDVENSYDDIVIAHTEEKPPPIPPKKRQPSMRKVLELPYLTRTYSSEDEEGYVAVTGPTGIPIRSPSTRGAISQSGSAGDLSKLSTTNMEVTFQPGSADNVSHLSSNMGATGNLMGATPWSGSAGNLSTPASNRGPISQSAGSAGNLGDTSFNREPISGSAGNLSTPASNRGPISQSAGSAGNLGNTSFNTGPISGSAGHLGDPSFNRGPISGSAGNLGDPSFNRGPISGSAGNLGDPSFNRGPISGSAGNLSDPRETKFLSVSAGNLNNSSSNREPAGSAGKPSSNREAASCSTGNHIEPSRSRLRVLDCEIKPASSPPIATDLITQSSSSVKISRARRAQSELDGDSTNPRNLSDEAPVSTILPAVTVSHDSCHSSDDEDRPYMFNSDCIDAVEHSRLLLSVEPDHIPLGSLSAPEIPSPLPSPSVQLPGIEQYYNYLRKLPQVPFEDGSQYNSDQDDDLEKDVTKHFGSDSSAAMNIPDCAMKLEFCDHGRQQLTTKGSPKFGGSLPWEQPYTKLHSVPQDPVQAQTFLLQKMQQALEAMQDAYSAYMPYMTQEATGQAAQQTTQQFQKPASRLDTAHVGVPLVSVDSPRSMIPEPRVMMQQCLKELLRKTPVLFSDKLLVTGEDKQLMPPELKKLARANSVALERQDSLNSLQRQANYITREQLFNVLPMKKGQFNNTQSTADLQQHGSVIRVLLTSMQVSEEDKLEKFFQRQAAIAEMIHPNIALHFAIRDQDSPTMVSEMLPNGDLKTFLQNNNRSGGKLLNYMLDVSMGMHYLAQKGLVHRNVAARSILVDQNEKCKISNFTHLMHIKDSPSTDIPRSDILSLVRCMAPECIATKAKKHFTTASDVWSFGILQWEMKHPNVEPYQEWTSEEVMELGLSQTTTLQIPKEYPSGVQNIMKACWQQDPSQRPSFLLIAKILTNLI